MGFSLSFLCNYIIGNYLNLGYPYNTFFFAPESKFLDFYLPYKIADNPYLHLTDHTEMTTNPFVVPEITPGKYWEINQSGPVYFPFAYWLILPFRLFSIETSFILYLLISIGAFLYICYREIYGIAGLSAVLVFGILSYPMLFLLNRGNFEFFIFVFLYLFFLFYERKPWLSTLFLAFAIASKLFPIGYVLILIGDKKYRLTFVTLGIAALLNLAGYALYPGGLIANIGAHLQNLRISSIFYAMNGRNIAFNNSFSAGIQYLILLFSKGSVDKSIGLGVASANTILDFILISLIAGTTLFIKTKLWKKAAIITCGILLLPPSSPDYRLILLYVPFFMWLKTTKVSGYNKAYAALFGLLFIPKSYLHIAAYPETSISTLLNPLAMIIMVTIMTIDEKSMNRARVKIAIWMDTRKLIVAASLFCVLIGISILAIYMLNTKRPSTLPAKNVISKLKFYGEQAQANNDYADALGYFGQWLVLEPKNPEALLGMARAYLNTGKHLDAYQQYKKVLQIQNLTVDQKQNADAGLQSAFQYTFCDFRVLRFKWANEIQSEYHSLLPDPASNLITCGFQ